MNGTDGVEDLLNKYYRAMFDSVVDATGVDYEFETYTAQQADPAFRYEFLATLGRLDQIRWPLAPSHGQVHLRLPCPQCGWAEKRAERSSCGQNASWLQMIGMETTVGRTASSAAPPNYCPTNPCG